MNRSRHYLSLAIGIAMVAWLLYGLYQYPDAPIRPCNGNAYCGKQGRPHTQEEFAAFKRWETILMWGWPPGMLALFLLREKKRKN